MSQFNSLGFGSQQRRIDSETKTELVMVKRALQRVLAFRGRSIDDIVNSPIVKNEIMGYWKLQRQIERRSEMLDLERQWNRLGQRL